MKLFQRFCLFFFLLSFTHCEGVLNGEFYISFTVSGLEGTLELTLSDDRRQVDSISVSENGRHSFEESIPVFEDFSIAIASQPTGQTCSIVYFSGITLFDADETEIYCSAETNTISATVTGLTEGSSLTLNLNGFEELEVTNGTTSFETVLALDNPYQIYFEELPDNQRCEISGDTTGRIAGEDITITYDCSLVNFFFIGGSYSANIGGRASADEICQQQADTYISLDWMSCSGDVMAFLSVNADDEIRDIPTNYDINANIPFHVIHPSLNLKIGDNWDDLLDGSSDRNIGTTFWSSSNNDGSLAGDACDGWTEVSDDSVKVGGFDKDSWIDGAGNCINTSRSVLCLCSQTAEEEESEEEESEEEEEEESEEVDTYTLGGSIEGLSGSITLSLNSGAQTLTLDENTSFSFETALSAGASYTVTISSFPEGQTCNLTNATGIINSNVTNISIQCELNRSYFYLSQNVVNADFGGRVAADGICEETYEALDLEVFCLGGIRAFITINVDDEIAEMPENYDIETDDPIYNAQTDLIIANNWTDLLDGSIQNPITADWWSGSLDDGTDSLETCNDWTERSDELVFHGTANETDSFWIFNSELDCNDSAKILCLCYQ